MKKTKPYVTAIILAAGSGSRMNSEITKQRITILGESILYRSVKVFDLCSEIDSIVVACRADELDWAREELKDIQKPITVISGGKTRAESSRKAFSAIPDESEFVAIHDNARCLVTIKNIEDVVRAAYLNGAATAGTVVTDTVKSCSNSFIDYTIPRETLFFAHTPQVFSCRVYKDALNTGASDGAYTDDNMLVEQLGVKIFPVDTGKQNIKITTEDDLNYAKYILEGRREVGEIRVGHGYDVHRLVCGRKLILGGVEIPHEKGLLGHSDADVLTHAIIDAILGACALGDIGKHFPDFSAEYKDISSLELLRRVSELVEKKHYDVVNIDATVVIQRPKISPFINDMIENISKTLKIEQGRINIKATTEEGLGFTGSEEGACAHAVATVKNKG